MPALEIDKHDFLHLACQILLQAQLIRGISSLHAGHHTNVLRGAICISSGCDVPQRDKLNSSGWVLKRNSEFEEKNKEKKL